MRVEEIENNNSIWYLVIQSKNDEISIGSLFCIDNINVAEELISNTFNS